MKSKFLSFAVCAVMAFLCTGCDKPNPATINSALSVAGEQGSALGLKKWAVTNQAAATETATRLKATIDGTILPYLNGADLPTSDLVQQFVDSTLLNGVPDEVKDAIVAASVALELYLPVPSATGKLTPDEVNYLKSFMTGLSKGCGDFLSNAATPALTKDMKKVVKQRDVKKNVWITGKTVKQLKK